MSLQILPPFYTALQPGEIRLLSPISQTNGDLHWVLKVARLRDELGQRTGIKFDALSYTWGDLSRTFPIICNEQEFQIHHNLNIALPYLARRDSQLPIWIDAVCINQSDEKEKMKQIRLMIDIYSAASQVWVWFGPGNRESGTVIRMLPEVIDTIDDNIVQQVLSSPKIMPWLASEEAWSSFYDLVENKWYSRLWVFQETAFPTRIRVLLGDNEVEWDTLRRLVKPTRWHFADIDGKEPRRVSNWATNIFLTRRMTRKAVDSKNPLTAEAVARILISTMASFCFDPRDRIFGLLGYIKIQVADDTSIGQMYTHLARAILLNLSPESKYWWTLLHSASSSNKRPGLPSWCPDFHDVEGRLTSRRSVMNHEASRRTTKAERQFDLNSNELVVRGQIFDTIGIILEQYRDPRDTFESLRLFHSWEESVESAIMSHLLPAIAKGSQVYRDKEEIEEAYWSTLLDGVNKSTHPRVKAQVDLLPYRTYSQLREGYYPALEEVKTME